MGGWDAERLIIDQAEILDYTGEDWQKQIMVADPAKPVRIVMAYTEVRFSSPAVIGR